MESEKVAVDELPLAIVRRVVKDKLSECSPDYDVSIHKEALLAFSESARIFIHYLSSTANDFCKDARRQTMKADDVFKAIEEMDFSEFLEPLQASLLEFKKKNAGKKASATNPGGGAALETKKRKHEGSSSMQKGDSKDDQNHKENDKEGEGNSTEENGNESKSQDNSMEDNASRQEGEDD
ncbi:hypothetical protein AALP_AA6G259000 [Arabis alpina]|uniref:Transcription factor CBF/NF-Y/archaeal histone domain-containing protein n=1 Tax=Arabis alpina TaxID=50452 RepID=A0A087GRQ9_ARAAL|nr:hypothetical protein AALP_AA6G259000 [Arabis alpina]